MSVFRRPTTGLSICDFGARFCCRSRTLARTPDNLFRETTMHDPTRIRRVAVALSSVVVVSSTAIGAGAFPALAQPTTKRRLWKPRSTRSRW